MTRSLSKKEYEELKNKLDNITAPSKEIINKNINNIKKIKNDEHNIHYIDSNGNIQKINTSEIQNKDLLGNVLFIQKYKGNNQHFFLSKMNIINVFLLPDGEGIQYNPEGAITEKCFYKNGNKEASYNYEYNCLQKNCETQIKQKDDNQMLCFFQYTNGKDKNNQEKQDSQEYEKYYKYKYQDGLSYHFDYRNNNNGSNEINKVIKNKDKFKNVKQLNIIVEDHGTPNIKVVDQQGNIKDSIDTQTLAKCNCKEFIKNLEQILKFCKQLKTIKIDLHVCHGATIDRSNINMMDELKELSQKYPNINICLVKNNKEDEYNSSIKTIQNINSKEKEIVNILGTDKNKRERFIIQNGTCKDNVSVDEFSRVLKASRKDIKNDNKNGQNNDRDNEQDTTEQQDAIGWKNYQIIILILLSLTIIGGIIYYFVIEKEIEEQKNNKEPDSGLQHDQQDQQRK